jgi:DNA invertase Pin-like site-specific DNA recombinase
VLAIIAADERRRETLKKEAKRRGYQLPIELASGKDLVCAAVDGRVTTVLINSILDLGNSTASVVQVLSGIAKVNADLIALDEKIEPEQAEALFRVVAALSNRVTQNRSERVKIGMASAKNRGVRCGPQSKFVNLDLAHELLKNGQSLRRIANDLSISPRTLKRRLNHALPR